MTKIVRREPTGPQQPVRMQDVMQKLGPAPTSYGVDPEQAKKAFEVFLRRDKGTDKPFCTCGEQKGWAFDAQLGVYVHPDPTCWKPSKAIYEAAVRAGLLGEVTVQ